MTESASLFDGVTEEVAANITLVLNQALEADIENINFKAVYLVDDEGIVTSTTNGDKSYVGKSYTEIKIESTNEDNEQ
jgi:C4-dicarboxylate-specific signal transduction histidine kinase